jgi:hypothetical protein
VPVTGVLLGDGRARNRWIAWSATMLVFLADVPLWGRAGVPLPGAAAAIAENAFVLACAVLLVFLPVEPADDTITVPDLEAAAPAPAHA